MRTRDFESPDDQMRINLIIDIVQAQHGANSMSTSLEIVRKFEEKMSMWRTLRGRLILWKHKRWIKTVF